MSGKRAFSPWTFRDVVDDEVNVVQSRALPMDIPAARDDRQYQVEAGDSLVTIATTEYGEPFLYWVIADRNEIDDVSTLTPGTTIMVPSKRTIDLALRRRAAAG